MNGIDLSIVIVTYNPGVILLDTIDSIPKGADGLCYEIILVDNQSQNGTIDIVAERYPEVIIIRNMDNHGFATANNQGLIIAQGEYLLLLNPDVIIGQGALKQLAQQLDEHPEVGIAGPRTYEANHQIALSAYSKYSPYTILWQYLGISHISPNQVFGTYRRACREATRPFKVDWIQGHCFMIKRSVYEIIGGLDEGLFLFVEEPDYCERAAKAGWATIYVPHAIVTHQESTTISKYPLLKMRHYHISPLYYFRKRGQNFNVKILKIGFSVELTAKWLLYSVKYRLQPTDEIYARLSAYPQVISEIWHY